jgi:hypothetical protein
MDIQEPLSSDYPWMDPANEMTLNARAQGAMGVFKTCLASLQSAIKIGYHYGETKDDWTPERVDKELGLCDAALRVLRGMNARKELGSGAMEVEKAGQAVIAKAIALGMVGLSRLSMLGTDADLKPRRAFDQLALAREGLLLRYKHSNECAPTTTAPVASENTQRLKLGWLESCWLPSPDNAEEMTPALRTVCVLHLASAWSCLIALEGYGYDLPVRTLCSS